MHVLSILNPPPMYPPILRLHPEIGGLFADNMDIRTVLRWRATCKVNYKQATASLRRTLTGMLDKFVVAPEALITIMATSNAVFGGELALCFFLRDPSYTPQNVDIFSSTHRFQSLCETILEAPTIQPHVTGQTLVSHPPSYALQRHLLQTLHIHLDNDQVIRVHRSYTVSPCAAIARAPTTCLSNFISAYGFACSHPELTLKHRSLLSDVMVDTFTPSDKDVMRNMTDHKITFELSPSTWPEYGLNTIGDEREPTNCWRRRYLCPCQGRYFGDPGSLVEYLDPLVNGEKKCVETSTPPFGPMVVWRLMSSFCCDEECCRLDNVLEEDLTSIPVLFVKDPFGRVRDIITNKLPSNLKHRHNTHRGRAASL